MNTINKDEAVEVLDNLLELSKFICYSPMNQDKKKIRKRSGNELTEQDRYDIVIGRDEI